MIDNKLYIGIPTYNRWNELDRCLESLIRAHVFSEFAIELIVIIYDNNSVDRRSYEKVISNHLNGIKKIPKISIEFFIQEKNIYFDGNYISILKLIPEGEYFWIIGDDDEFSINSLSIIKRFLKKNKPLFVQWYDLINGVATGDSVYKPEIIHFETASDFLFNIKSTFYLSAMINIKNSEPIFFEGFTHYVYYVESIGRLGGCIFISERLIRHNIGLELYTKKWAFSWYGLLLKTYIYFFNCGISIDSLRVQFAENFLSKTSILSTLSTVSNLSSSEMRFISENIDNLQFIKPHIRFILKLINLKFISLTFNCIRKIKNWRI